jgi:hypothetical protein
MPSLHAKLPIDLSFDPLTDGFVFVNVLNSISHFLQFSIMYKTQLNLCYLQNEYYEHTNTYKLDYSFK